MGRKVLFRIEGCNFGATVFDTDDLSTIRGSSLAYLRHPLEWASRLSADLGPIDVVVVGASDGVYRVTTEKTAADVERAIGHAIDTARSSRDLRNDLDKTLAFLTFTYAAVEETDNFKNDLAHLIAKARARQLQQPTVDVPSRPAKEPCKHYDRIRPADTPHRRQDGELVMVSASVGARRIYGLRQRQSFYQTELQLDYPHEADRMNFSDSFKDLIEGSFLGPLPPALMGKHAVFYLDGNKFTKIRETVAYPDGGKDAGEGLAGFADHVREHRRHMLRALLTTLGADPSMRASSTVQGRLDALKFETLLWGGDEALFVMPAWKLMDALPDLAELLDDDRWTFAGHRLTHAVGIVICSIKTPIAVSKALANEVADAAKPLCGADLKLQKNVFSIQVLESVEPPRADVNGFRRQLYGTDDAAAFTLVGGQDVRRMVTEIRRFQADDGGLPRSQLFKLINTARSRKLFDFNGASTVEQRDLAMKFMATEVTDALKRCGCTLDLKSEALGYTEGAPLMPLVRLAEMWDYVDPFGASQLPATQSHVEAPAS